MSASEQIEALLARNRQTGYGPLYDLLGPITRYHEGKGLRPAICLSAAHAARGHTDQAACSAAALELFHNAFLLHDDVEDASDFRRGRITMLKHRGAPVAVNVGDATNVMAVQLLLDNTKHIGVHKALLVFSEVERIASMESVEGQAIELAWIDGTRIRLDRPRLRPDGAQKNVLVHRNRPSTGRCPVRRPTGCEFPRRRRSGPPHTNWPLCRDCLPDLRRPAQPGGRPRDLRQRAGRRPLGRQAHSHALAFPATVAPERERRRALTLLRQHRRDKTAPEVAWLRQVMEDRGSLEHGRSLAWQYCERALAADSQPLTFFEDNDDRRFLREMLLYVVERVK